MTVAAIDRLVHHSTIFELNAMRLNAVRVAWPGKALILLTIEDTTRQHEALERLQSADQQKDMFLAMLAHELRNPLAAIRNGLEIWQRGDADAESVGNAQAAVRRQLDHEIGLVDDLLDVSRITRGNITLGTKRVDLIDAVRHSAETLREEIRTRQHEVTLILPEDSVAMAGDAMRLEQIATNLLGNAVKYTPGGGHIRVSLERSGDVAILTVTDDGIGMRADLLPAIFNVFVQADRSLDRKSAGLGLGLALVRRLVELHRGSVRAFSGGPGRGSTFVVEFPVLPPGTAPERPARLDGHAAKRAGPSRILVVDDNVDAAESSAALLRLDGHDVQVASDGESALRSAEDFHPDVLLLDIGLPGMNGYEVAHRLRAMPDLTDALLIAISGYSGEEHLQRCREAGFDCHLVKPADLRKLDALIASYRRTRTETNNAS